ncbi:MAG: hypothetical protein KAU03_01165, partial [Candidatus Altiarchaeales archaeon]|nr:hypothetical protein [Candidatus Altiarchaeales archaeon]
PTTANWDQLWYNVTYVAAGYLNSTLNEPSTTETNNKTIYDIFTVNATVICKGNTGDTCGLVNGTARYNASSSEPDTQINTTTGAQPFYADLGNQTCGKLNATAGQNTCTLTWQVNATQTGKWKIDVLFTSSVSAVDLNDTENAVINVLNPPTLTINLSAPLTDPGVSEGESFELNCSAECSEQDCVDVNVFAIYCSGSPTCTPNKFLNTTSTGLSADYDNISLGNISAGTQETATFNISAPVYGDYVIACNATSGNAGDVTSLPTNLSFHVNDHPTAAFTYPCGGDLLSGMEKLNASTSGDADGDITNYLFELDNNTNFDSPSTLCNGADENCTFNTTTQTECEEESMECYLKLTVTDDDGAQNYTIIQVGIDNTPPTISNEQINDTSIGVNEWVCLNATAQDSLNVSTVIAEIDIPGIESNENLTLFDNGAGCDLTAGDDVYSGGYQSTQSGTYNWTKTYANDTTGNTNTSLPGLTWNVTSDATMTVNMTKPAADLEINQSSPNNIYNQTCSVSCDLGGIDCEDVILHAQYNPGTWTDVTQSTTDLINDENNYSCGNLTAGGPPCSHTFNITSGSSSGNNTWEIRCGAGSSNAPQSQSTAVNLTVTDNSGPVSILDQPKASGNITTNEFTVNASVTDSGVGVISWVMFEYRTDPSASWQPSCNDTDGTAPFSCVWNLTGLTDSTTYEVRVRANDSLGNLGEYDVHTGITVDREEPQINLSSPENDSYFTTGNIDFNFTATDNLASTMNCCLYIDSVLNQTNSSTLNNSPTTFYVTGVSEGQHTWYMNCSDEVENSNVSETRNFTVDYTLPNWSKQNQTINGQYTGVVHRGGTIKLSAYWTDNIRLSKSLLATNETGTWENKTSYGSPKNLTGASGWSNFTWSNSSTAPGTKVAWRIYANDTTGNTNHTDVMSFTVWGWAEISSSHLNPSGIKEGESTTMNCRVQDNTTASPIEGYTVYFYNESSFLGANTTGSDGYATFTFTVNEAGTYTITCNITDNATLYYNVSANNEGVDILGVGYGLSTYSYANTTYHRAYEGVESNTTTQIDDPYTDLESDNDIYQNFTAGSGDYAYTRFEMRIDEEINTVTKINITWMGFGDIGSGTAGYNLSIYNITNQSWMQVASYNTDNTEQTEYIGYSDSFDDIVNSSGYIKILARSYSPAPKTGAGGNRWVEIDTDYIEIKVYYDILSPTVTLSSPEDYHTLPSPLTFNCSVSDDYRISNVTLYGNWSGSWHANETNTSGINNINYTFTKDIGNGVYMWNCRACDKAGNCDFAVLNRTLTVDSTPPTIQQQSPISGSYTTDTTINFTFIATDNMVGELNCSLYIDNQLKDTNESTKNNTLTVLTATSLSLGEHFWNITCWDK